MIPSRFVLVVVFLLTLSAPARSWADGGPVRRPFRGYAEGMVVGIIPPNGLIIEAVGTATHLGNFVRQETLYLNPDGSFQGSIEFVSANGDSLTCIVNGAFTSPTDATGTYVFNGGTGRFAGASGQASFQAFTPDGIQVSAKFAGSLIY